MNLSVLAFLAFVGLASCCQPPDCDRPDCGTCANACCNLNYYFNLSTQELNDRIVSILKSGGPDMRYQFVDAQDLRPYNISADFISQGIHTTLVMRYNDTLNFAIYPESGQVFSSRLSAFSISQIATAYCDDGQNYNNLAQLVKGLALPYLETTVAGCPKNP